MQQRLSIEYNLILIFTTVFFLFPSKTTLQKDPSGGYMLSSPPGTSAGTTPKKELSRQEEMRRARERQQKLVDERSKEAAIQRKEQETKEKDRRNHVAKPKKDRPGDGGSTSTGGRNPLQPWASNGPSYRYENPTLCDRRGPPFCCSPYIIHFEDAKSIGVTHKHKFLSRSYCHSIIVRHKTGQQSELHQEEREVGEDVKSTFLFESLAWHP